MTEFVTGKSVNQSKVEQYRKDRIIEHRERRYDKLKNCVKTDIYYVFFYLVILRISDYVHSVG